ATATTAAPTTAAPTTAAPATATPTTSAPITAVPTTIRGPFGDIVGQPVAQPTNAQGAAAFALQAHKLPAAIANDDTPTYFYAQWLRLLTPLTTNQVLASANGYVIDAGQ
ncbi:MAG: hypothetical protein ABIQ39_11115, partial [Ilumatobacteraceae bacterium]